MEFRRLALLSVVYRAADGASRSDRSAAACTTCARRRAIKCDEIESITQETLSISGITLIKSFAREAYERARFYDVGTRLMGLEIDLAMVGRWFLASVTAMVIVGPAVVWFGGGWYAIAGTLQVGVIVAFVSFIQGRLYGPAAALAGIQVQIVSALAVFERIFGYLDMQPEEYEPKGAVALGAIRGEIAFEDVTFSYGAPARTVLENVSFHVGAGEAVAFVGPSGAGKTTITQLVPRFYDPQSGRVVVDGHDVRTVDLESLRRNVGHRHAGDVPVPRHGREQSALRQAGCDRCRTGRGGAGRQHPRFSRLASRRLRNDGRRARAGTVRRRAPAPCDRARAVEGPAHLSYLDEATSSLDSENEAAIQSRAWSPRCADARASSSRIRLSTILGSRFTIAL